MAEFEGQIDEVFPVQAAPEAVARHFMDREMIVNATTQAESATIHDDGRVSFVLEEQSHGPYTLKPAYTVAYVDGDMTLSWTTTEGNMVQEGQAWFTARSDGGTDVRYKCRIALELPVPRLVAMGLRGVINKLIQPSIRNYVLNMIKNLPSG